MTDSHPVKQDAEQEIEEPKAFHMTEKEYKEFFRDR